MILDKAWYRVTVGVLLLACFVMAVFRLNESAIMGWFCACVWYVMWLHATGIKDPNYD